jgi:hypothetical protein
MKKLGILLAIQCTFSFLMAQPSEDYKLLFEENFTGNHLNENDWTYRLDRRKGATFNGLNLAGNVFVKDGFLHIAVRQDTINGVIENTGGGIISKHLFGFGYYETLSKPFMDGTGVHSAFWQAGGVDPNVENRIFEIDSYEIDSKLYLGDNNLYLHLCSKEYRETPWPHRSKIPLDFNEDGWLLDAYEYTPEGVVFYDNGKVVAKAELENLVAYQKVWLTALNGFGVVEKEKQPGETLFDYFRFYSKEYPGANILSNGDFEYNQDKVDSLKPIAWNIVKVSENMHIARGDAFSGDYFLHLENDREPGYFEMKQELNYIVNGKYDLSAMVRSSGGFTNAEMIVDVFNGAKIRKTIPVSASWEKIQITDIPVSQNAIAIGFVAEGDSGTWMDIDDVQLMIPDKTGEKPTQKPLEFIVDPIWHLGKKEPIVFPGDNRFFFFDRNVGLGEAITISFRLKADLKADMTPLARMPKTGTAGWAVQLTKNGDVNFIIGSQSDNFSISAKNVYESNEEYLITCIFNKGVAEIAINGNVVARENGIEYTTSDITAAGRLGDTQTEITSVAEVFIPDSETDKSHSERDEVQQFKGSVQDLRIYNRAISGMEIMKLNDY